MKSLTFLHKVFFYSKVGIDGLAIDRLAINQLAINQLAIAGLAISVRELVCPLVKMA
ncbi:MAG: hypothetical protein NW220_02695 [Leptolyngbyaceae cyanobacterium bins.349]|nr:hypothetical protein [Leptolyngbyaceae cyanobacterium bins.349]